MILGRVTAWLLAAMVLVAAESEARPLQRWEHGGAQLQLNRVRLLTERLSRLNVQQQMRLGGATRASMVATATEIDTALRGLGEGSPRMGVPAPPTLEIRERIQARDPAWVQRPFFAKYDPDATWLGQLQPAFGEKKFFFDE